MANEVASNKLDIARGGPSLFINLTAMALAQQGLFDFPKTPIDVAGLKHREIFAIFEKVGAGALVVEALWIDPVTTKPHVVEALTSGERVYPKGRFLQFRIREDNVGTITDGAVAVGMM